MISPDDMAACRAMIRTGSLSFHAASRLLPARVRDPALALYAFCRVADDDVDEVQFARSGVNGTLRVSADHFELDAKLGFLLGAFKEHIEGEIVKNLDQLLAAKKPAARKKK